MFLVYVYEIGYTRIFMRFLFAFCLDFMLLVLLECEFVGLGG